ncbi:MAG TPA: hypothetical protein VKU60_17365, partial [Chloroflexota bacterium]|nr:hypothetical protein [Chloroflexota bacterium]
IAAAYLPWSIYALPTVAAYEPGRGTATILSDTLRGTFELYNFGANVRADDVTWLLLGSAVLLALGLVGLSRLAGWRGVGLAAAYQLAPLLLGLATLLHTKQFGARFLFLGSPGYLLVIAGAITLLGSWRWRAGALPVAALAALSGYAIHNTLFTEQFVSGRYSQLAAYLQRHVEGNDGVVLDGVSQSLQYWYYAQLRDGVASRVEIMPKDASGGGADGTPVDLDQTQRALDQLLAGSSGVWLVDDDSLRYDPNLDTQRLLADTAFRASSHSFEGPRLDFYAVAQPGPLTNVSAKLGDVSLIGVSQLSRPAPAGQVAPLTFVWQAALDNPPEFKESLRLLDATGTIVSQEDQQVGAGLWPPSWQAGATRKENRGLLIPVGLAPGSYKAQLVAYDAASGKPLGPTLDLGSLQVDHSQPQRPEAADLPAASAVVAGEHLAGVSVDQDVPAGETLHITLLWSGGPTPDPESVPLAFSNLQIEHQIGGGAYPTTDWQPHDVVRDDLSLRVPPGLAAGSYPLTVAGVHLASINVLPTRRRFSPPPIQYPFAARFDEVAQLLGYGLQPSPGGVHLQLVWKSVADTTTSYTVFVHVLDDDGNIVSQVDQAPGTDDWLSGQVITTQYDLAANPPYRLELGLYDSKSGARLQVCQGGAMTCASPSDHLDLPQLSS